eukprot:TRINITY_DN1635_c1_g1_i1.p1 TRINITY_DN1635_c1_g1~~TRINITY_DN1635_c1_g1_i1.p1  ORF type:complete len:254 (-),score=44.37 TRINITY_DN1635_c1_g1_i1:1289-2050(-)
MKMAVLILCTLLGFTTAFIPQIFTKTAPEIQCPPADFNSLQDFTLDNLVQYIAAPWYVQYQMPSSQLPEDDLYCVFTQYIPLKPDDITYGVKVLNYANQGQVNGPPMGTSGAGGGSLQLIAIVPDGSQLSKLRVGLPALRFAERITFGDYWIVAAQPSQNTTIGFDWAIISAGAPKTATDNGCRTGSSIPAIERVQINGIGLWYFTREKVASEETISALNEAAKNLGFDTSVLKKVEQDGCLYADASPTTNTQ